MLNQGRLLRGGEGWAGPREMSGIQMFNSVGRTEAEGKGWAAARGTEGGDGKVSEVQGWPARLRSWAAWGLGTLQGKDEVRSGFWKSLWLQSVGGKGLRDLKEGPEMGAVIGIQVRGAGQPGDREGDSEAKAKGEFFF